jgi:ectoine hydroxylase-related dioxygenase (phytanoyl-CoA dioxygenase family)
MAYESERYICTPETATETLDNYGVAIIPNILNPEECENLKSEVWDYFEHITQTWELPVSRENEKSWRELFKLFPKHSMLHQHFRCGHSQAVWNVRQNPNVVNVFSEIWKTKPEDLLSSFDGLSFAVPPEITNRGWYRNNTWYHCDQSFTRPNFECIQGWVTAFDVNEKDATLAFYEGSHKFHADFGTKFEIKNKKDWYKLTNEEEQFFIDKGCPEQRIKCPAGSLVLWDSRTIHCGTEAMRGREHANFRLVVYTCYQPRTFATEKQLIKKRKAFEQLRMTSHWPAKIRLFPKIPYTYGNSIPEITHISNPILTPIGFKLAGF